MLNNSEKNKKLLAKLISDYKGDDLAVHLASWFHFIKETKGSLYSIQEEKRNLQQELEKRLKELDSKLKMIQGACTHLSTTYYADPAGGSDSFSICDICEAQL